MTMEPAPRRASDDQDDFDDAPAEAVVDHGELAPATRRVLLALIRGPYLRASSQQGRLWAALIRDEAIVRGRLADLPGVRWRDTGDGANPYAGLLAYADRLLCTPDSVNMLSEAAATWAPLYLWSPATIVGRPRHFIDTLLASGRARAWDGAPQSFDVQPLRETARIARAVRERLFL